MTDPTADRDPLEALATEFLERLRRGESPSVEAYAEAHADLAEEVRDLFPTLLEMERAKADAESASGGPASLGPVQLDRLGDFRIVRELGRGGMGVVYEAEQESLGRRVAIKVLPRQVLLDEKHLLRFRREAHVAASLHHTNIVPIIGVGEHDGFHYYVMQLVHGVGLDRVIRSLADARGGGDDAGAGNHRGRGDGDQNRAEAVRRKLFGDPSAPQHWRRVAEVGRQVARALAYAHGKGAVHRDVKPANLLMDPRGTVWVTDFGLAKAARSDDVTEAGTAPGTLRYMAPELFCGSSGDERSDIYSLGVTLYELLVLRPAHGSGDARSLAERVTSVEPSRPRQLVPALPRDLETIVLKAMAPEPGHRYGSAGALADDLERFLSDLPIAARHVTTAERVWRWCRRNRAVAALSAITLALVVATAVTATVGYLRTRAALRQESLQRRRAEALTGVAGEALDRVFARLGPVRAVASSLSVGGDEQASVQIVGQPAISPETAALLEEMLPFYDRLAEQSGDDPALERRAANARQRVGDIRQRLGQYESAAEAYRRALRMYGRVWNDGQHDVPLAVAMATVCNELGRTLTLLGQSDAARLAHERARHMLHVAHADDEPQIRYARAETTYLLYRRVHPEPGQRPPEPVAHPGEGPAPHGRPQPAEGMPPPGWPKPPPRRGPGRRPDLFSYSRGALLAETVELLEQLLDEHPGHPGYRRLQALCYREMDDPRRRGRPGSTDRAIAILEELVADYPAVADYRFDLCETYAAIEAAGAGRRGEVPSEFEARLRKALGLAEGLVAEFPNVAEYQAAEARVHHKLGRTLRHLGRLDEAEQHDREALRVQTRLASALPEVATYRVWAGALRNALADGLVLRRKPDEALSQAEESVARLEGLLAERGGLWYVHGLLAEAHRVRARALQDKGEPELAQAAEREAEAHQQALHAARGEAADRPAE